MVCFPGIVLATVILLVPGSDSQCIDCENHWKSFCNATESGYYCMPGTIISKTDDDTEKVATQSHHPTSLYAKCVPFPYAVEYVQGWCCFWSKRVGCQAAVHQHVFEQPRQSRFCERCRTLCICSNKGHSGAPQLWQWILIVSCASFLLYLSQKSNIF